MSDTIVTTQFWSFHMLKNKGLGMTILVVICLILKLFLRINKLGAKGLKKKKYLNFLSLANLQDNFFVVCTCHLKHENNFLFTKHRTRQNLFNILNIYPVLFCLVLLCPILTFYKSN
jgi:hypothetical protein